MTYYVTPVLIRSILLLRLDDYVPSLRFTFLNLSPSVTISILLNLTSHWFPLPFLFVSSPPPPPSLSIKSSIPLIYFNDGFLRCFFGQTDLTSQDCLSSPTYSSSGTTPGIYDVIIITPPDSHTTRWRILSLKIHRVVTTRRMNYTGKLTFLLM